MHISMRIFMQVSTRVYTHTCTDVCPCTLATKALSHTMLQAGSNRTAAAAVLCGLISEDSAPRVCRMSLADAAGRSSGVLLGALGLTATSAEVRLVHTHARACMHECTCALYACTHVRTHALRHNC